MSVGLDSGDFGEGTRFRLFPQAPFLDPGRPPELVVLSSPAGTVDPGPSDDRMYVVDPIGKPQPHGLHDDPMGRPFLSLPPWPGPVRPPALPDAAGHFDYIPLGTPEFEQAHVFAAVRRTLDVWEHYFGHPIPWHFGLEFERLEIGMLRHHDNALMGYGFMEVGSEFRDDGSVHRFALNFDVLAHETGHAIIYSQVGLPLPFATEGEYYGFHESAADMTALIAAMHFHTVIDDLLANTRGNLYALNRLNRIGELAHNDQIRVASNPVTLARFADGWDDEHDLSLPLTGALFDTLVDVFHEELLERRLIAPEVEDLADHLEYRPELADAMQAMFDVAYVDKHAGFAAALEDARDLMGVYLAETWRRLSADFLNYDDVLAALLEVDEAINGGRYARILDNNFSARGIGHIKVGPRLPEADEHESHAMSDRTIVPDDVVAAAVPTLRGPASRRAPYRYRRMAAAGRQQFA